MLISDGINHGKLQSIIVGELKKAGLKHRLKKIILKNVKDHKAVFGAPLMKVPSCSVICCGSTLSIPIVVSEMSSILRTNAHVEGLFRKAGSQTRQRDIKRLLDAGGCVSEGHHPIDVASVLKLYLRCLPEPLISAEVQDLLLRCRVTAGDDSLVSILNTLLLLPVLHVHLLHYIMELLNFIASKHRDNLMDSSNLAIVLAPSIMPLPASANSQRLEHHVAIVKIFIENSRRIGLLTDELINQLDDDSDIHEARRKKRRSGSLNRMLNGLRKMVSGNVNTPATVKECDRTPFLNKSAAKRKFDTCEGLSAKIKKEIQSGLPQKELSFTPMKMGVTDRKRVRLSMIDIRNTPHQSTDINLHKNSETSTSSENVFTSSEELFNPHDTIDLSADMKQSDKDYVRISKLEYEEIKSRVSAIENRLSREFTDVIPRVQPLQQVQNVYEQTLEDVAMLNCAGSEHLARRLSKELKIRPKEETKIIRSPSARKIGSIRRRSKENLTKIVRHKSWNASTYQASHMDRFYPYVNSNEINKTNEDKYIDSKNNSDSNISDDSIHNVSSSSQKYRMRKRISLATEYGSDRTTIKSRCLLPRRSLNLSFNKSSDTTIGNTMRPGHKTKAKHNQYNESNKLNSCKIAPPNSQHKWKSAAAFFLEKTGELDGSTSGRPSVNKLRKQNAGGVLAKAKLFESSSDKSSEKTDKIQNTVFARKPRLQNQIKSQRTLSQIQTTIQTKLAFNGNTEPQTIYKNNVNKDTAFLKRHYNRCNLVQSNEEFNTHLKATPPSKSITSPQSNTKTPHAPALRKPLCPSRTLRTPVAYCEQKKNTPLKAVHVSPKRRSPRHRIHRSQQNV
ncbi:unnamed protein product [Leptosia nina]|uniref:Rho-GAP domain-containing protein n=1 Tax=Leptosia nina TaxID=320188 RepID=A0AAV1JPC1_9NEOP